MRKLHIYGLTPKASEAPDVNLGFEIFRDVNQALVKICHGMVLRNDPAHQWPHIVDVAQTGVEIAQRLGLNPEPFLYAALCHDLFSGTDREIHHELAAEAVRGHLRSFIPERWVEIVARMCAEHRASYTGDYSGIFEEAFSAADRGPVGPEYDVAHYWRSFQYSQAKHPEVDLYQVALIVSRHMRDKFGSQGYAKYPKLYLEVFGQELAEYQKRVDARDIGSDVITLLTEAGYINSEWR